MPPGPLSCHRSGETGAGGTTWGSMRMPSGGGMSDRGPGKPLDPVIALLAGAAVLLLLPVLAYLVMPTATWEAGPGPFFARFFAAKQTSAYVLFVVFCSIILISIRRARLGADLYIRPIAGLKAVDEAIGRATEMGRKILYVPGIQSMDEIQTIASLAVLSHVAKQTARYGADLDVANRDPLTYAAARETVKQAYIEAGRPDAFRETLVNYVTFDQWALTAALTGMMVRERPAAHFFIGAFYAEALMLAEVGQTTGAIQIAGTAELAQLPFFVCSCDYTLIGEEFYAASGYLSKEPLLLGSTKGQDWVKGLVLVWLAATAALMIAAAAMEGPGSQGVLSTFSQWMVKVLVQK